MRLPDEVELPTFSGGAIGYLGFACADWFEPSLKKLNNGRDSYEDARFMFFTSVVAFDHAKQLIKIISLVIPEHEQNTDRLRKDYEAAKRKNADIRDVLETGAPKITKGNSRSQTPGVTSNWTKSDFEAAVAKVKELINAGECYQVVLSQCFSKQTLSSPVAIYRGLRSLNPSPYMFLLNFEDSAIIGASPEMLVRCRGRNLEYRPIAGTRPRGKSPDEDIRLAQEMQGDKKEVAEHLMLVDLGRNDLGRVSEFGSVEVTSLMHVEKYSHVQHLVSSITSRLRHGLDRFDALSACFPAGTVSGAPKVRAIEIISGMEPTPRGVYSGAVGYFDYAGNMDTCIAIRTLVLENGIARVQAGAGIVADSVPENEFAETVNKAKALLKTIEIAEAAES
jgi:anthranilate synthase component 1